ncbi:MAG: NfeD family protein [Candidatus Entotheonellia bacterium]
MSRRWLNLMIFGLLIGYGLASETVPPIHVLSVADVINPVSSEYITESLKAAIQQGAQALIIQLDTPGGLDKSMRLIIKEMLNSPIPVIVYVAPSGSRAASAGTFITLAAHVAAMAPGTNIGAAHPVAVGSGEMGKEMAEKVTNDAAAYIKSIAEQRGRNVEWAEKAVRESISASETEALQHKLIDVIAVDLNDLLRQLNGRKITMPAGERTLRTEGAALQHVEMSLRQRLLSMLADPNVAYMLLMLGTAGLFFEIATPGVVLPGVIGGISLLLGLYALQLLPVNYAGLGLIVLALILFIAEIKVTSYGALTIGGIIAMILGALMLFDAPPPLPGLSLWVVVPSTLLVAAFFVFLVGAALRTLSERPYSGREGLLQKAGVALTPIDQKQGKVFVAGERWDAHSEEPIEPGVDVEVLQLDGMTLRVKKKAR